MNMFYQMYINIWTFYFGVKIKTMHIFNIILLVLVIHYTVRYE